MTESPFPHASNVRSGGLCDIAYAASSQDWPEGGLPHGEHPYDYGYGEATEVLPEGNVECGNCGAIIAWEGAPPTDCLKCGEAL